MTKTHCMSSTRFYKIWCDFRKRCSLKSFKQYCDYGGRGISVSEEWQVFENFYNDMFSTYNDNLTLERVDVNSNYCKENCIWLTKEEQAKNKRRYKTNKLGVSGVYRSYNKGVPCLRARIQDSSTGRRLTKTLSLNKYEEGEALKILEGWLKEQRVELGYGESHGS